MKTFIFNQIDKKIVNINVFDAINGWERLKAMPQAKSIRKLTKNFFDTSIRVPVNFPKKKKKKKTDQEHQYVNEYKRYRF